MKKYRVYNDKIEHLVILRETSKQIFYQKGSRIIREFKFSTQSSWYDTYNDAKDSLITHYTAEISRQQSILSQLESKLEQIKLLTENDTSLSDNH